MDERRARRGRRGAGISLGDETGGITVWWDMIWNRSGEVWVESRGCLSGKKDQVVVNMQ